MIIDINIENTMPNICDDRKKKNYCIEKREDVQLFVYRIEFLMIKIPCENTIVVVSKLYVIKKFRTYQK